VYGKQKVTLADTSVTQLKKLGADIVVAKYSTKYSSYVFENPAEVHEREGAIDNKWKELTQFSTLKKQILDRYDLNGLFDVGSDLAREIEKERLRLEFAHLAGEFNRWARDTTEAAAITHFGFTLEEVEKVVCNGSLTRKE